MKKLISLILITFLALFTLVACGDNTVNVEGITLNKNELSLEVDSSFTLEATILPDNATNKSVEWSSNNVQVATVTSGIVTAVSKGEAIISAKTANGEFTATCKVIVNNKKPVTKFNNLNYVAFGDSITFGQDGTNNGVQLENPYPKLLAEALGFNSYNNMGISGATLCLNDKVVCMTDIITSYTSSADVISVMLGVNDFSRSLPLGTIEDNSNQSIFGALNKIATHFKTNYPNAFGFFMTPYQMQVGNRNSYTVNSQGYNLEDVANAVKQVAENFGYPVVDMFNNGNFEAEMYSTQSDGLHPSQQFYIDYTVPQLVEFLEENYGKEPIPEAPIDFSNLTMACIGDSITFGYEGDLVVPMENPYPNEIKNILGLKNVDNFGICSSALSGTQYTPMWERVKTYNGKYDIISLMGGINDFGYCYELGNNSSNDTNTIYGALKSIAKTLKNEHKESFIFFMTPLKSDLSGCSYKYPNGAGISLFDIVTAIKDVANSYNIPVLDLYFSSDFNPLTDSYNGDKLHPTQEFMNKSLAPQIVEFIKENYGKEPAPEAPIDFSDLTYLAFGDSITEGAGLENKGYSYPSQVGNILGCQVTNKGVSGSSLAYDSSRHCIAYDVIQNTKLGGKYDIISVTGGSNDKALALPLGTINDNTYNTIYGSLNVIADSLTTTYPNAFIFFMTPIKNPTCDVINSENYNLLDICNAIKQVASKYNFLVLDLYNTSQYESVDCGMYAQGSDGWHPHKEFILQYMAPQIAQFIKENYKPKA